VDSDFFTVKTAKFDTKVHYEPFFFLTNKTGTPYGDKIGWIKPMLRFFSINFFRASYLDVEREYIKLTGG